MSKTARGFTHTVLLVSVLAVAVLAGLFFISASKNGALKPVTQSVSQLFASPTPTPFAFQEITIPYLRNRSYESSLGTLEKLSESSDFTSYVTSYLSDGLKVYGLLTIPKGEVPDKGWPAIVFVHGYIPPQEYRTRVNYLSYVNFLAQNGFVVFKIDLRGHDNSEGEPGGGYYSGDYVIDTLNAHSALANSNFVNPKAIGLWGHSMAGNIVFRSFVASLKVPAVVIWAGAGYTYSDLQSYRIQDSSYQTPPPNSERSRKRQELRNLYGDFDPEDDFWKQVPGTNYLEGVKGAVQVNHAVNDNVVSLDYSRNLMSVLDNSEIVHKLNEYPSGGHNLEGASFTQAMQETVDFFTKYLIIK